MNESVKCRFVAVGLAIGMCVLAGLSAIGLQYRMTGETSLLMFVAGVATYVITMVVLGKCIFSWTLWKGNAFSWDEALVAWLMTPATIVIVQFFPRVSGK